MRLDQMVPGYFALVMSTGLVSLTCHLMGFRFPALVLFWMNVGFYLILWCLSLLRLIFYPRRVLDDFQSHTRGVGFFTVIAGTCLLGSQCLIVLNNLPCQKLIGFSQKIAIFSVYLAWAFMGRMIPGASENRRPETSGLARGDSPGQK